jgi:hypothetical protein
VPTTIERNKARIIVLGSGPGPWGDELPFPAL